MLFFAEFWGCGFVGEGGGEWESVQVLEVCVAVFLVGLFFVGLCAALLGYSFFLMGFFYFYLCGFWNWKNCRIAFFLYCFGYF